MERQAPGQAFAATFVDQLAASGLRAACVAPGSRSAPLAIAFARHPAIRVYVHVDERSCSFFALGLAKATGTPVAVLTTSGTAAAELHPAVIEARHGRVPLVLLTADRPPELRDNGANQSIDQARIYGTAPRWHFDPGPPEWIPHAGRFWRRLAVRALAEAAGPPAGPVHLNLPFREPLTPEPGSPARPEPADVPLVHRQGTLSPPPGAAERLAAAFLRAERPVVVAGSLAGGETLAEPLSAAVAAGVPILAEPTSGLRLAGLGAIDAYDALLRQPAWAAAHAPDLVLRLGATPTSKALNAWLAEHAAPTWLVDPEHAWADPDSLAADVVACDPGGLLRQVAGLLPRRESGWLQGWMRDSELASRALERSLAATPLHEGHAVRALARRAPAGATVVIGSSMAVRDADTFWPASGHGVRFLANRGASGIDGVVSTALGAAAGGGDPVIALLGDLSLYHDMNGLWAARRHGLRAGFVVLDNDGGGIFSFLPPAAHTDVFEEIFGTPLGLRLEDVARLHRLRFLPVDSAEDLEPAIGALLESEEPSLVAVRFSREASVVGHRAAWSAVEAALADPGPG